MAPPIRRRTTKKEPRLAPWPAAALEERIEEIMDRVQKAGDNHVERVAALEEYLTLARAHEGETWFDAGAWSEDLADSCLALGRAGDAVRTISDATRSGCAEGAEMLCELAEKLVCSGHEPQARLPWQQARAGQFAGGFLRWTFRVPLTPLMDPPGGCRCRALVTVRMLGAAVWCVYVIRSR